MKSLKESLFDRDLVTKSLPTIGDEYVVDRIGFTDLNKSLTENNLLFVSQYINVKELKKSFKPYKEKLNYYSPHGKIKDKILLPFRYLMSAVLNIPYACVDDKIELVKYFDEITKKYLIRGVNNPYPFSLEYLPNVQYSKYESFAVKIKDNRATPQSNYTMFFMIKEKTVNEGIFDDNIHKKLTIRDVCSLSQNRGISAHHGVFAQGFEVGQMFSFKKLMKYDNPYDPYNNFGAYLSRLIGIIVDEEMPLESDFKNINGKWQTGLKKKLSKYVLNSWKSEYEKKVNIVLNDKYGDKSLFSIEIDFDHGCGTYMFLFHK